MPTHAERRIVSYRQDQMFDLVADVAKYPEFLPWCLASRVRKSSSTVMTADLVIGFKRVRETFTSRVELVPFRRIEVQYIKGPLRYLKNSWSFEPHPDGCEIDFTVDFEFRNKVLQKLIGSLFGEAFRRMVGAFEARAQALYGAPDGELALSRQIA